MGRSLDLGPRLPGFRPQYCQLLALTSLTSPRFNFLYNKTTDLPPKIVVKIVGIGTQVLGTVVSM